MTASHRLGSFTQPDVAGMKDRPQVNTSRRLSSAEPLHWPTIKEGRYFPDMMDGPTVEI